MKLPAAIRTGVYRDRPHHEQAAWQQRIRDTVDPEHAFLAEYPDKAAPRPKRLRGAPIRAFNAFRRSLPRLFDAPPGTSEYRIRRSRRVKGLDD